MLGWVQELVNCCYPGRIAHYHCLGGVPRVQHFSSLSACWH